MNDPLPSNDTTLHLISLQNKKGVPGPRIELGAGDYETLILPLNYPRQLKANAAKAEQKGKVQTGFEPVTL